MKTWTDQPSGRANPLRTSTNLPHEPPSKILLQNSLSDSGSHAKPYRSRRSWLRASRTFGSSGSSGWPGWPGWPGPVASDDPGLVSTAPGADSPVSAGEAGPVGLSDDCDGTAGDSASFAALGRLGARTAGTSACPAWIGTASPGARSGLPTAPGSFAWDLNHPERGPVSRSRRGTINTPASTMATHQKPTNQSI